MVNHQTPPLPPDLSPEAQSGPTDGRENITQPTSHVKRLINKTKRVALRTALAFGLTTIAANTAACALEQQPQVCLETADIDEKPLDNFYDNYDVRKVDPLPEDQRGKRLELQEVTPEQLQGMFTDRFKEVSGLKINFNNIFEIKRETKQNTDLNNAYFKTDLADFLQEIQSIDQNATINHSDEASLNFTINGKDYNIEYDYFGLVVTAEGQEYQWNAYQYAQGGYLWEIYIEDGKRYVTGHDKNGSSIQKIYENKELAQDEQILGFSFRHGLNGQRQEIKNLEDIKKFTDGLTNANLLYELLKDIKPIKPLIEEDPHAVTNIIKALPSNDPIFVTAVWSRMLSEEFCLTEQFGAPEQILEQQAGTQENYAMLHALWARLNGHQITIYDVRVLTQPDSEIGPATIFPAVATDKKTGEKWLMMGQYVQQLQPGETLGGILAKDNRQLSEFGATEQIMDKESF